MLSECFLIKLVLVLFIILPCEASHRYGNRVYITQGYVKSYRHEVAANIAALGVFPVPVV